MNFKQDIIMPEIKTCVFLSVFLFDLCDCGDVFHEGSKITFYPNYPAEYFGYAVAVGESGLLVGAPKASTTGSKNVSAGVVFNCSLQNLQTANVSCTPLKIRGLSILRNGMWFGASLAVGSNGKVVICAPRWARIHNFDSGETKQVDVNGVCYIKMKRRESFLFPLDNYRKQWFQINNSRTEYVDYLLNAKTTSIKYYTLAQAGMALKVTEDRIIIGAPGLLVWSGGIVQYTYNPAESSISYFQEATYNPFFTYDVRPDEYFGYSVESGVFEDGGKTLYVVGGPRAKRGFGMVLVIEPATTEVAPLNILAKLEGPQLGAYFGASLSCLDINADGRIDLLVGAPNYVKQFYKDDLYDQGSVFVYLNKEQETGFVLEYAGHVTGSEINGAKFGYSIVDLGDVDVDGYNDVAVSSPWENEGAGVVYIYRGDKNGLRSRYMQRIVASEARGFGMGLTRGFDVDHNNCNDLVVGAYKTNAVYMYRCIPTVKVEATIKVPEVFNLPQNTTNFTAEFCVNVQPLKNYRTIIKMELNALVTIDPEGKRAIIAGNSIHSYKVLVSPSSDNCEVKMIEIEPKADLSRPIPIIFDLEPIDRMQVNPTQFKSDAGRASENSNLHSTLSLQLVKECGKDLICSPWIDMNLEPMNEPYIPGSEGRLGAIVRILSKKEPVFGVRINLTLPSLPKRVPNTCFLQGLNLTCNLPSPFYRNQTAVWEVEFEYTHDMRDMGVTMIDANIDDPVTNRNISANSSQYLEITIMPMANICATGKALPNTTLPVSREKLYESSHIAVVHYFQVTNAGPSDCHELSGTIVVTGKVSLGSKEIAGCEESWDSDSLVLACTWSVNAMQSLPVVLSLHYDLDANGKSLMADTTHKISSTLFLDRQNKTITLTTTLILDPAPEHWKAFVIAIIIGFLLLAILSYTLYKCGFFSRTYLQGLEKRQKNNTLIEEPGCSSRLHSQSESGATFGLNEGNLIKPSCSTYNWVDPAELDNSSSLPAITFQGPSTSNGYMQNAELNCSSSPTTISEATAIYKSLQKQLSLESDSGITD